MADYYQTSREHVKSLKAMQDNAARRAERKTELAGIQVFIVFSLSLSLPDLRRITELLQRFQPLSVAQDQSAKFISTFWPTDTPTRDAEGHES